MVPEAENKKKLESFFEREYNSLKAYVGSRIKSGSEVDTEDIIQDVALKLFSGADRNLPINNVPGFVYRSIRNKIIDVMRKGRRSNTGTDEDELKLIEFTETLYGSADHYSEQMKDELKNAIMNLKGPYRDVIVAIDFQGYSYKEISEETGIPEGTLMSHRHRAISQLHKTLKKTNASIH